MQISKKIIAVVPLWDDEKESIWMLPGYMDGVKTSGAIPIILPLSSSDEDVLEIFDKCDGLLMTGGHHQAVKKLGTDLEIMAKSEDGLVEAVRHTEKSFVWAFQWHPEFDFHVNQNSRKIFDAFVGACGQI